MKHEDYALWDGAYVLGALSSSDRREFEDHLLECVHCSRAVAELTVLPGLLAAVPRDIALAEPESLPMPAAQRERQLFGAIRAHGRRTRIRDTVIAAAAAVAIAVPVGLLVQSALSAGPTSSVAAQATDPAQPLDATEPTAGGVLRHLTEVVPTVIDARAALTAHTWGTTISLECTYRENNTPEVIDPEGSGEELYGTRTEQYALTVTDADGRVTQLATWIGAPGGTVTPQATISTRADSIRSVDVRAADSGEVLLTASL